MSDENEKVTEVVVGKDESADSKDGGIIDGVKPKKKGKGKRILIIILIVLVVLVGGVGVAYLTLHDKPEFCNAICHQPMDPYVLSYQEGTSIVAGENKTPGTLMVTTHKEQDINCLGCHEPAMSEQISEGIKWVTGNYTVPITMKVVAGQPKEGDKNGAEFCLREGCHDVTTMDALKTKLSKETRNPHNSHLGEQDCSNCHQSHEQSVNICTQCHADAPMPDGWLTYQQKKSAASGK